MKADVLIEEEYRSALDKPEEIETGIVNTSIGCH